MRKLLKKFAGLTLLAGIGLASTGCATHTGTDALVGGAVGTGLGAAIGSFSHARAGEGALIGGAIGAIGGAIVGDQQDREERYDRYAPPPPPPAGYYYQTRVYRPYPVYVYPPPPPGYYRVVPVDPYGN